MLRILHVYMGYYQIDKGGGISVYVRNIAERLAKKHDVTVFATNPGGLPSQEVQNGVKIERFKRFAPSTAYFFSTDMLLRLRKAEFDVVHAHGYQAFPFHFAALAKRKKFVASAHYHGVGHSPFRNSLLKLLKPFGGRTLRVADKIITVSEYERSLLFAQFKLDPRKVVMIPCGVDLKSFYGVRRQRHDFRSVLFVGRLEDYKGAQYLIEALPMIDHDVILEIVGKGPMKPFLRNRAVSLGVMDRVRFYEELPRRELLQKYVDSDVFVLPSQHEAYSIAVAEALTAGIPCIVANTSALSEWIDGKTCYGIKFPIELPELQRTINKVLDTGSIRPSSNLMWKKILDWNEVADRVTDVYRE